MDIAAQEGNEIMVRYLLDQGAEISSLTPPRSGGPGAMAVFQALLDYGWDINSGREPQGALRNRRTPLCSVINDEELVKWFLEHGADPSINDDGESSPLDAAAARGNRAVISLLLSHGAKLEDSRALQKATISADIRTMEFLLDLGFDINAQSRTTKPVSTRSILGTALHAAAKYGHADKVKFLLEKGADRHVKIDVYKKTPAEWAEVFGKMECYELLK